MSKIKNRLDAFQQWLSDNGATILPPTNPYEVLRYRAPRRGAKETVVIYENKAGRLNVPASATNDFKAFVKGEPLDKRGRASGDYRKRRIEQLLERDGDACCFCGEPLGDDITLEHWLPIKAGGNNRRENLGLAHEACNKLADDLSVMEKIALRDKLRSGEIERPRVTADREAA